MRNKIYNLSVHYMTWTYQWSADKEDYQVVLHQHLIKDLSLQSPISPSINHPYQEVSCHWVLRRSAAVPRQARRMTSTMIVISFYTFAKWYCWHSIESAYQSTSLWHIAQLHVTKQHYFIQYYMYKHILNHILLIH